MFGGSRFLARTQPSVRAVPLIWSKCPGDMCLAEVRGSTSARIPSKKLHVVSDIVTCIRSKAAPYQCPFGFSELLCPNLFHPRLSAAWRPKCLVAVRSAAGTLHLGLWVMSGD